MDDKIKAAILEMADQTGASRDPDKVMKFSQAAQNLAHAGSILVGADIQRAGLEKQKKAVGAK